MKDTKTKTNRKQASPQKKNQHKMLHLQIHLTVESFGKLYVRPKQVFEILPISLFQEPFIFFGNVACHKALAPRQHALFFKSKKAEHATVFRPAGHAV